MDGKLIEVLESATRDIIAAQMKIHQVSTSRIGFDLSKPLNILYKELDAHRWLLMVYSGDKDINEIETDCAIPQSQNAYKNLNS